jgi:hypothetical protein
MSFETSIYRQFGDQAQFAILCAHDPFGSASRHVFGRMCIRASDAVLGNFNEPACVLNVTASHLQEILKRLPQLESTLFQGQSDAIVWDIIDRALYLDDNRSDEDVFADSARYSRYEFLTNGGDSFDESKSFIIRDGECVRLLFKKNDGALESISVDVEEFCAVVRSFLEWIDKGGT